jgi:hypothetical protein
MKDKRYKVTSWNKTDRTPAGAYPQPWASQRIEWVDTVQDTQRELHAMGTLYTAHCVQDFEVIPPRTWYHETPTKPSTER